MDDLVLTGGCSLFGEIDKGITEAKVFVACLSGSYSNSINCRREIQLAIDRKKLVIPALVAKLEMWPPSGPMAPLLAGKLYVDVSDDFDNSLDHLVRSVVQVLSA
mmetsp:Transcript_455/g.708  ORF Transcript_455/g.708 Transcript_455/m.708 type:complete len:105 (-) Transcript_455:15-329(-)